ncbi:MAG: S41 family peptidase [Planctomycetes bacterium]|nr:S41 family peptidase [Planctomycetota bacterium]
MKRDLLHLVIGVLCGLLLAGILRFVLPDSGDADVARYREVRDFVRANYVRPVTDQALLESALHGMVEDLDRYSRFLGREQVAEFERETGGRYRGIGVVFRDPPRDGQVLFCLPDSPAERAGIRVGDRLISVDGVRLADMQDGDLSRRVAAASDTSIDLVLASRDGEERSVSLETRELVDPTVRHARVLDSDRGIGYLAITSFSHQTPDEFDRAIEDVTAQGARALVLDVRGNPGGVLSSAVRVANRFLAGGVVVTTEGRAESTSYEAAPGEARYADLPLVVLIDSDSASASEVLAGALQDHRAAVLVGAPTYGKGMVQKIRAFGEHDAIVKLTSSYYYTPAHRNLERTVEKAWEFGLMPDFAVDVPAAERKRVHTFLATHTPPRSALDELRRWEQEDGLDLIPEPPPDAELDAAVALLSGERPRRLASAAEGSAR